MKRQSRMMAAFLLAALLLSGCTTTEPAAVPQVARERMISDVVRQAGDAYREFYDASGKRVEAMTAGVAGSVSVFLADGTGQDNYSFDEEGRVVKHMRSHGDHYNAGVWVDVTDMPLNR